MLIHKYIVSKGGGSIYANTLTLLWVFDILVIHGVDFIFLFFKTLGTKDVGKEQF